MAILRVRKGAHPGAEHPLLSSREPTTIGRDASAAVCIEDGKASRRNSAVFLEGGRWFVEDLRSSNGTYLDGKRVDRSPLQDGSCLQVGATLLDFDEKGLAGFQDMEVGGIRVTATAREAAGVFTLRGREPALDRDVRVDWLHPSRPLRQEARERVRRAFEEASRVQEVGIPAVVRTSAAGDALFVVVRGTPWPSVEESLAAVLALPVETRLSIFRQIVQVLLERATWEHLRSPVGLAHIGIEWQDGAPLIHVPPVELSAVVAESTGDHLHLRAHAAYLPPEFQERPRPDVPPLASAMYNVGALGYHILTGRPPAGDGDVEAILASHRSLMPAPASLLCGGIPQALSDLLSLLLDKDPARRPAGRATVLGRIPASLGAPRPVDRPSLPSSIPVDAHEGAAPRRNGAPEARARPPSPTRPTPLPGEAQDAARVEPAARETAPESPRPRPLPGATRRFAPAHGSASGRAAAARVAARDVRLLPLWIVVWIALFFAARHVSAIVFRALEGS